MIHDFFGTHIISEFYEIQKNMDSALIPELIARIEESCARNQVEVLKSSFFVFNNGAYTVCLLLAESHLAIHTYIEYQAAFVDIFTCGRGDPDKILNDIESFYSPSKTQTKKILRGDNLNDC